MDNYNPVKLLILIGTVLKPNIESLLKKPLPHMQPY